MTYDCFTFLNELDLLEIRFSILDSHVDIFVIAESTETFSGKPKPLYLRDNFERFKKWADKILLINVPPKEFPDAFQRAGYQKDMLREVLAHGNHLSDDDVVYFGDLDEIWKPCLVTDDNVYNLGQLNYCYFLNNRSSEEWIGTVVGKWKTMKTQSFNYWRAHHDRVAILSGWHFTNMGGADQIRLKLDSYDHQEFNNEQIRADIERRIENGEDYVGRQFDWQGNSFAMWIDEIDLPQYLKDNKERYKHLFK